MKRILFAMAALSALTLASCKKVTVTEGEVNGTLSFAEFEISCDDTVDTKASVAAGGNYVVSIYNTATESLEL